MPGRMKGFHYYNAGAIFETLMAMIRPILSKKLQDRVRCYIIKVTHGEVLDIAACAVAISHFISDMVF